MEILVCLSTQGKEPIVKCLVGLHGHDVLSRVAKVNKPEAEL